MTPCLAAAACTAMSGPLTTPLVELYTASACDACRPAERWLAARDRRGAAAITLHMDAMDYESPEARTRQRVDRRQYGLARARRVIVTSPRVLLQGAEVAWETRATDDAIEREALRPEAVHIAATLGRNDAGALAASLRIDPVAPGIERARLYYAGFLRRAVDGAADPSTQELTILQWSGPLELPSGGAAKHDLIVSPPPTPAHQESPPGLIGLVAFVEAGSPPRVVQSLVLPLCRNAGVR